MSKSFILCDSREKDNKNVLKTFREKDVLYVTTGLSTGDYVGIKYENGYHVNKECVVDLKNKVLELAGNLCGSKDSHEREKAKLYKAKEMGYKRFVFLIYDKDIKEIDELETWSHEKTKIKGNTLLKTMKTMNVKYGCEYIFVNSKELIGEKIVELVG